MQSSIGALQFWPSLSQRSERFRGVGEQRKSEKRDFPRFAHAKNGAKEGEGNAFPSFPFPTLLFSVLALDPFFAREKHGKFRFSVFLCPQTLRKRLLRRLTFSLSRNATIVAPGSCGTERWFA